MGKNKRKSLMKIMSCAALVSYAHFFIRQRKKKAIYDNPNWEVHDYIYRMVERGSREDGLPSLKNYVDALVLRAQFSPAGRRFSKESDVSWADFHKQILHGFETTISTAIDEHIIDIDMKGE